MKIKQNEIKKMAKKFKNMSEKEKQEECEKCVGRKYPSSDYCEGCKFRNYRT